MRRIILVSNHCRRAALLRVATGAVDGPAADMAPSAMRAGLYRDADLDPPMPDWRAAGVGYISQGPRGGLRPL